MIYLIDRYKIDEFASLPFAQLIAASIKCSPTRQGENRRRGLEGFSEHHADRRSDRAARQGQTFGARHEAVFGQGQGRSENARLLPVQEGMR